MKGSTFALWLVVVLAAFSVVSTCGRDPDLGTRAKPMGGEAPVTASKVTLQVYGMT